VEATPLRQVTVPPVAWSTTPAWSAAVQMSASSVQVWVPQIWKVPNPGSQAAWEVWL
jgi:hypothetical protein